VPATRHQRLLEALSKGDVSASEEAMREHIVGSLGRTLKQLEGFFAQAGKQSARYVRAGRAEPVFAEAVSVSS
jgi:hypothetical protein